jgi:hypothetical protein
MLWKAGEDAGLLPDCIGRGASTGVAPLRLIGLAVAA